MKRKNIILAMLAGLLLVLPWCSVWAQEGGLGHWGAAVEVQVKENRLTVRAYNQPVSAVLEAIGRAGDISVENFSGEDLVLTVMMESVPVEQGLKRLVHNFSHAILYGEDGGIHAVYLYAQTGNDQTTISWSAQTDPHYQPDEKKGRDGVLRQPLTPHDKDPHNGMTAIDPLARFEPDDATGNHAPPSETFSASHDQAVRSPLVRSASVDVSAAFLP